MNTIERIQLNRIKADVLVKGRLQGIILGTSYVTFLYTQPNDRQGRCEIVPSLYAQLPELVEGYADIIEGVHIGNETDIYIAPKKEHVGIASVRKVCGDEAADATQAQLDKELDERKRKQAEKLPLEDAPVMPPKVAGQMRDLKAVVAAAWPENPNIIVGTVSHDLGASTTSAKAEPEVVAPTKLRYSAEKRAEMDDFQKKLSKLAKKPVAAPPELTRARKKKLEEQGVPYLNELNQWSENRFVVQTLGLLFVETPTDFITFRMDALRLHALVSDLVELQQIEQTGDDYVIVERNKFVEFRDSLVYEHNLPEMGTCYPNSVGVHLFSKLSARTNNALVREVVSNVPSGDTVQEKPTEVIVIDDSELLDLTPVIASYEKTGKIDLRKATRVAPVSKPIEGVPCENCSVKCFPTQDTGLCDKCERMRVQYEASASPMLSLKPEPHPVEVTYLAVDQIISAGDTAEHWPEFLAWRGSAGPGEKFAHRTWARNQANTDKDYWKLTLIDSLLYSRTMKHIPPFAYSYANLEMGSSYKPQNQELSYNTALAYFFGRLLGCLYTYDVDDDNRNHTLRNQFITDISTTRADAEFRIGDVQAMVKHKWPTVCAATLNRLERMERLLRLVTKAIEKQATLVAPLPKGYDQMAMKVRAAESWSLNPATPAGHAFWRSFVSAKPSLSRQETDLLAQITIDYSTVI